MEDGKDTKAVSSERDRRQDRYSSRKAAEPVGSSVRKKGLYEMKSWAQERGTTGEGTANVLHDLHTGGPQSAQNLQTVSECSGDHPQPPV